MTLLIRTTHPPQCPRTPQKPEPAPPPDPHQTNHHPHPHPPDQDPAVAGGSGRRRGNSHNFLVRLGLFGLVVAVPVA